MAYRLHAKIHQAMNYWVTLAGCNIQCMFTLFICVFYEAAERGRAREATRRGRLPVCVLT